ncbi:MAG: VOC family protein [Woeseiaceae bacterium]|nr:VOC family protein [Woeseiaceae bacterium]
MAGTNTPRFQRANYVVRDIDKSLELYRDVLGFEVAFILDSPEDSYSYPVFEIDQSHSLRFAVLSAPGQPRVMALTEVPAEMPTVPFPRRAAIVIDVTEVDAVIEGARAAGCEVYEEEELVTHDGRRGREVGIVDFDGNLVVIYNIPATN